MVQGSRLSVGLCYTLESLRDSTVLRRMSALDVLVFPELVDGGYAALAKGTAPHDQSSPVLRQLRLLSTAGRSWCVAGSLRMQRPDGTSANTSLVFKSGREVARYEKIHLFRPAGDRRYFSAGRNLTAFTVALPRRRVKAGVMICYDLRFPELGRALGVMGVRLFFVPARWPLSRNDAWRSLLKARAIENQAFVVGCNAKGGEGGISYVFDPMGREVFNNNRKKRSMLDIVQLDLRRLRQARALHNAVLESRIHIGNRAADP